MELTPKQKEEFAKGKRELTDYIALADGESYTGIFKDMPLKPIERVIFNRPVKSFKILLEDPDDHQVRTLYMRNKEVINKIVAEVKPGDIITIFRQGEGRETRYHIKLANEKEAKTTGPLSKKEKKESEEIPF